MPSSPQPQPATGYAEPSPVPQAAHAQRPEPAGQDAKLWIVRAAKLVVGFNHPIDAEIIGNTVYVLEYGGKQSIWAVTLPR